mmetsp:Transcript_66183/g.125247  ORF Transcript_66183/g.125247 Transcript_66183/m.125247 type:complete len:242 (-) Transcript_66183:639-1364(-)
MMSLTTCIQQSCRISNEVQVVSQVDDESGDVVDNVAIHLVHPLLPSSRCELLGGGLRILSWKAANELYCLLRADKLPDTVTTKQNKFITHWIDAMTAYGRFTGRAIYGWPTCAFTIAICSFALIRPVGLHRHQALVHIRCRRDARIVEAAQVPHSPGHVQTWVHLAARILLALGVDPVIPASVEDYDATRLLDACALLRKIWLVVDGQVYAQHHLLALGISHRLSKHYPAVTNVGNVEHFI